MLEVCKQQGAWGIERDGELREDLFFMRIKSGKVFRCPICYLPI
jgi:hypothetical protein